MTEILTLIILVGSAFQVKNDTVSINMVNFSGYAESPYFRGDILPGAVDTQTYLPGGKSRLSARYMLEGIDGNGDSCRIYVDNEVTDDVPKGYTKPTIITDSRQIASLAEGGLVGKMDMVDGKLNIRIFAKKE